MDPGVISFSSSSNLNHEFINDVHWFSPLTLFSYLASLHSQNISNPNKKKNKSRLLGYQKTSHVTHTSIRRTPQRKIPRMSARMTSNSLQRISVSEHLAPERMGSGSHFKVCVADEASAATGMNDGSGLIGLGDDGTSSIWGGLMQIKVCVFFVGSQSRIPSSYYFSEAVYFIGKWSMFFV